MRNALPLGYRATGLKAPLPERPRGERIDGARSFATLAYADELLFDPQLLRAYGERFSGADDATLVDLRAARRPGRSSSSGSSRWPRASASRGRGAPTCSRSLRRRHPDEAALAASVDAVLSLTPPRGAFRLVPHFHHATAADLRSAAQAARGG